MYRVNKMHINRRKIRMIESSAKCRHQKTDLLRDFAASVYLSEALHPS